MLTNPSTLGLFERRIEQVLEAVHAAGALAYMDGANMNAILGKFRPGAAGFDVMHFNTHKTFSTPHGGGGPGAGPVAVTDKLAAVPALAARAARGRRPSGSSGPASGQPRSAACAPTRAAPASSCAPMRTCWRTVARASRRSARTPCWPRTTCATAWPRPYEMPFAQVSKHEFVASAQRLNAETGVRMLDVAKRLIDYGFHPPTIYFPLTVEECMLVEPTETESVETLDAFADALIEIAAEAHADPELVKSAPHDTPVRRLDEATAARQPDLRWRPMTGRETPCPD